MHRSFRYCKDERNMYDYHWELDDWPMDNSTVYVDCNGTLIAGLRITIK